MTSPIYAKLLWAVRIKNCLVPVSQPTLISTQKLEFQNNFSWFAGFPQSPSIFSFLREMGSANSPKEIKSKPVYAVFSWFSISIFHYGPVEVPKQAHVTIVKWKRDLDCIEHSLQRGMNPPRFISSPLYTYPPFCNKCVVPFIIDGFRDTSFVYSRDLPPDFLEARTP